jgi:hypothetical protein
MNSRNLIVLGSEDKEIVRFLRGLIAAGSVTVELEDQRFLVTARSEKSSFEARQIIGRAPISES